MKRLEENDMIDQILENEFLENDSSLEEWLGLSEDNRREYLFFKALWCFRKGYNKHNRENTSALIRLNKEIDRRTRARQARRIGISVLKYAAVILSVVFVSYVFYQHHQEILGEKTEYVSLRVSLSDSIRHIKLEDGSTLIVNRNSSVRYPVHFSSDKRIVYLDGEAYFDVHHENSRPFIVQTHSIKVKVLGTAFDVCSSSNNPVATTTLVRGKILVQSAKACNLAVLSPNEQISYNDLNEKYSVCRVNPADYTYWLKGELIFNRETLKHIFDRLEKIYNVKIYNQSGIESKYHFVLNSSYSIDSVFQMIRYIAPVEYKIKNNNIYVYKKKGGY